jgi:hypothetical protein
MSDEEQRKEWLTHPELVARLQHIVDARPPSLGAAFERAVEALLSGVPHGDDIDRPNCTMFSREIAIPIVRAVLRAIREPDEAMRSAINVTFGRDMCTTEVELAIERDEFVEGWQALIDDMLEAQS